MSEGLKRQAPRLAGLALATGVACFAAGAQAQPFFGFFADRPYAVPETLSPEIVYRQLVRRGFQPVGRIRRNGRVFLADVVDPNRRELRLVIDSFDGTILERYVLNGHNPPAAFELPPRPPVPVPEASLPRGPSSVPMADPNLPPPRLLPAPKPRSASHGPSQDRAPQHSRVRSEPEPAAPAAKAPAAGTSEAAEGSSAPPAPAPSTPAKTAAPKPAPAKPDGPGYANGVPINPLE